MKEIVTHLIFLSLLICGALAIDCHQCDTRSSPTCQDDYTDDNVGGCGDRDTHCSKFKIIEKVYDSGFILGDPTVTLTATRGCASSDVSGDHCSYITSAAGYLIRCLCSTDECNSSPTLTFHLWLTILTTICSLLIIKKCS